MNFVTCCKILQLTSNELGFDPSVMDNYITDALKDEIIFFIKRAYRKRSLIVHPDKGGTVEAFQSLLEAYETALRLINEEVARKQNSTFSSSDAPPKTFSCTTFEELLSHISFQHPDLLNQYWNSANKEIEDFSKTVEIFNARLIRECAKAVEDIFEKAFETYLRHSSDYYENYLDNKFAQFQKQKSQEKTDLKEIYDHRIGQVNILIIIGIVFCFLLFPLILSIIQWNKKQKLVQEKEEQLSEIEKEINSSKTDWANESNLRNQWEQEIQLKTIAEFQDHYQDTTEGLTAKRSANALQQESISRQLANKRLSSEVRGMQRDPSDTENLLYFSLFKECNAFQSHSMQESGSIESSGVGYITSSRS